MLTSPVKNVRLEQVLLGIGIGAGAALLGVWTWSRDASLAATLVFGIVTAGFAYFQWDVARTSLAAAYGIAEQQSARADAAQSLQKANFIAVVLALGSEALAAADAAEVLLRNPHAEGSTFLDFRERLSDIHVALQPIRAAVPPDAALILSVGRLSRALELSPITVFTAESAKRIVLQHARSIRTELDTIRERVMPPPDH
jgi:hypothetical protein